MDGDLVDDVVTALEAGGAVVLPTDTVYGLIALPGDQAATARLFTLKGRAEGVPLAVLCASTDQAFALADRGVGPAVAAVAERWWPGPLTLVLPRRPGLALHLGRPSSTIGLRVPDHPLLRAVVARVGPIAATSANRHGAATAATAPEVASALGEGVALVVDGGRLQARASTVIDATTLPWTFRRRGSIDPAEIFAVAAAAAVGAG